MPEPRRVDLGTCSKCDDHNNPCVCRAACDCEGHGNRGSLPDQEVRHRFTIRWLTGRGYVVDVPNYEGGEVVSAESYDGLGRALQEVVAERDRLRAEVETLRGEVMARDGVIRDRDTENERLREFAESAAAAFHALDYEPGYLHARAVLARTSDEEKAT